MMKISKHEVEGWQEVECLMTCTVFADSGPNAVVEGKKYFIDGGFDPAIFVKTSEPKKKVPGSKQED